MSGKDYTPRYISPSAFGVFQENKEKYYLQYRTEFGRNYRGKIVSAAMFLGSAFDQLIKDDIKEVVGGVVKAKGGYGMKEIVEPIAQLAYVHYMREAFPDLVCDIQQSEPVMEDTCDTLVWHEGKSVRLFGKPDVYTRRAGRLVILDWKCNAWFKQNNSMKPATCCLADDELASITPTLIGSCGGGYVRQFGPGAGRDPKPLGTSSCGIPLGPPSSMKKWLAQLTMYSWMLGEKVGSTEAIVGIDHVQPGRIVQYRSHCPEAYQYALFESLVEMWETVTDPDWRIPKIDRLIEMAMDGHEVAEESLESIMDVWRPAKVHEDLIPKDSIR